jgi:phosphopantothenoylcysteine decarboxylase/phosphopantothenate--cysteine ligase
MVVMNSLQDKGAGFGYDTNKVTFYFKSGLKQALPLKDKKEVAHDIVSFIEKQLNIPVA